jgi:hypothetical protein
MSGRSRQRLREIFDYRKVVVSDLSEIFDYRKVVVSDLSEIFDYQKVVPDDLREIFDYRKVVPDDLRETFDYRNAVPGHSTAIAAFAARGYLGTTTVEVARHAGISQAYLYRLFPDKETLFAAVVQRCFARIRDSLSEGAAAAAGSSPEVVLSAMGGACAQLTADQDLCWSRCTRSAPRWRCRRSGGPSVTAMPAWSSTPAAYLLYLADRTGMPFTLTRTSSSVDDWKCGRAHGSHGVGHESWFAATP